MTYAIKTLNNMNDYTKGYFNGRNYEQDRILAIFNDYPEIELPAELVTRIQEGDDQGHVCLSRNSLQLVKSDAHFFGRRKALGDAAAMIELEAATRERPTALNFRRLLLEIASKVRSLD